MRTLIVPRSVKYYLWFLAWAWRIDSTTLDTCKVVNGSILLPYTLIIRTHWIVAIVASSFLYILMGVLLNSIPFVHEAVGYSVSALFILIVYIVFRVRPQDAERDTEKGEAFYVAADAFWEQEFRTRGIGSKLLYVFLNVPFQPLRIGVMLAEIAKAKTCFYVR